MAGPTAEQKRAGDLADKFFGANSVFDPKYLDGVLSGIISLIKQGQSDEQILKSLSEARPDVVKAVATRQAEATAKAKSSFAGFATPQGGSTPAAAPAPPTNAVLQWMQKRFGLSADQATVALADDTSGFYLKSFLSETEPKSVGASAPVARYGFESIGGKVYRANDLTGALEDTGISAPGFSEVGLDKSGNLTGIDADGAFKVIQPNYGFAGIDPAVTAERKQKEFDITAGQNATDERGRNTRNTESEQAANQRQQLSSQTTGFQSVNALAPLLGNLALDNAKFTRDTLSTPADFLARAFFQRGQTSPLPQVSQADVINQLRQNIAGFQGALSTYGNTFPGFSSSNTAATPQAAPSASAGFSAPPAASQPGPQTATQAGFESIQYNPQTQSWSQGGKPVDAFAAAAAMQAAPAPSPVGFTAAPAAAAPTSNQTWGATGFAAPTLPTPAPVTQAELQAMELANRPPAINDVLSGRMPNPLNVGFSLPTPQMLGALTPDEKKAFGTTLATQYNTTLDDVGFAVDRQFKNPETRRRASVVGF